ncbi:MAG: membrane metalloprotease, partial [Marinirhabdus sp.]
MKPKYAPLLLIGFALLLSNCKNDDDNMGITPTGPMANNLLALGLAAQDFLGSSAYPKMVVEFVYSDGFRPKQETLDDFRGFLTQRLNKPSGITFVETVIAPPAGAPFNSQEIRDIEDNNRTQYTLGGTIALYVYFSSGSRFGDTDTSVTLGTAYRNTSIVVYQKTLRDISLGSGNYDLHILESTTLQHEFGHVLGLVNIVEDDVHTQHEDGAHPKHCFVENCLMYFEAQAQTPQQLARLAALAD